MLLCRDCPHLTTLPMVLTKLPALKELYFGQRDSKPLSRADLYLAQMVGFCT